MMQVDELVDIHYSHLMNINSPHLMNVPLSGKCYHYDVSQPCIIKLINLSAAREGIKIFITMDIQPLRRQ